MAKKDNKTAVKFLKKFMYKQVEVGPETTEEAPMLIPQDDARYLIACELAEEASVEEAVKDVESDALREELSKRGKGKQKAS